MSNISFDEVRSNVRSEMDTMLELDHVMDKTKDVRSMMVDKLTGVVKDLEIDPYQKNPLSLSAQVGILDTLNKIINDQEKSFVNRAKLSMSMTQAESDNETAKESIALIKGFMANRANMSPDEVRTSISECEDKLDSHEVDIKESELEAVVAE